MLRWPVVTIVPAALLLGHAAQAQQYTPRYVNPHGVQLVAVYLGNSGCIGNHTPGIHEAVDSLKILLQGRAASTGRQFRAIGIALDWSPDSGAAYLRQFGAFDQVNVGQNWFNMGAAQFIFADSSGRAFIPQVIILEQNINAGPPTTFGPTSVLKRVVGGDSIVAWVRAGAPLQ